MRTKLSKGLLTALLVLGLLLPGFPIVAEGQGVTSEALELTTHPTINTTADSTTLHRCPDSVGGYTPAVSARQPARIRLIDDADTSLTSIDAMTIERHDILESASRFRRVNLATWVGDSDGIAVGDELTLDLFADASYVATIDRVYMNVNGTISVRGRLEECPASYILMSTHDGRTLASVRIPAENSHYMVLYEPQTGDHYLAELDPAKADEVQPAPPLVPPPPTPEEEMEIALLHERIAADLGPEDPATIDVMIVYTPAAAAWADLHGGGIDNVVAQAMEKAELVMNNSEVGASMRLVHSAQVDYDESHHSSYTHISRLRATDDGHMDEVHEWRDQYGADLVALFANVHDVGGLGYLLSERTGRPASGFSLTRVQGAATTYIHVHEMGHNMGCSHHKEQHTEPGPTDWEDWPENTWSAGWRWTGQDAGEYCSVMTYGWGDTTVAYFSNPGVTFQGEPTGHAVDGDNARTVREIKHVIAAYRDASVGCVEGYVYDLLTSDPLAGVEVSASEAAKRAYTDSSGYYRLCLLPGEHTLVARAFGYYEASVVVEVFEDAWTTSDWYLEPMPTGFIEGTVTDMVTDSPIGGAIITVLDTPFTATTDKDGGYSVEALTGTYDIRAWAWGYWPTMAWNVKVVSDETVTVDFALKPGPVVAVLGDYESQLTDLLMDNGISAHGRDWDITDFIGDYDVVVVNRPGDPGEESFLAFLDAAGENDVGVIFTSSDWSGWQWGISLLRWYLNDPEGHSSSDEDGNVYYQVTQPHPIFAGWQAADAITIITGGDYDHAWFWDYSGDTIGLVGSEEEGVRGDAVAVGRYGGSTHVLLASLAPRWSTNVNHWTEDARTIFTNAVCFAGRPSSGIQGTVRDARTEEPLARTEVLIQETGTVRYTDESGYYRFYLPPGSYTVTANIFGHYDQTVTTEVVDFAFTAQDFALETMPTGFVEGTVTDMVTDSAIEGTIITLLDTPLTTTTDKDGRYSVEAPAGPYDIRAWAWGYRPTMAWNVKIVEDETAKIDFALKPVPVVAVLGDYHSQLTDLLMDSGISAHGRDWDITDDMGNYDVVVVNLPDDPGEDSFLAFLDAASENDVGVIFTSSYWFHWQWGISLLRWYLNDPEGHSSSDQDGNVYYQVTEPHPIFAGWQTDDAITIITGGYHGHAWFRDYSGDTIARVGSEERGIRGDAVAVGRYGGSTHVLLASLAPFGGTNLEHWTEDARTIFINAVGFAAPTRIIMDWHDLHAIRYNTGGRYILASNLDSATDGYTELAGETANDGKGWEPIGTFDVLDPGKRFTGTFDGQGYQIRDLFINRPNESYVGLFGDVGEGGVIKDVGVVNADVTGASYVGGLVGANREGGAVINSYTAGSVTGDNQVGGLVGANHEGGAVSNSYTTGSVTGGSSVGGLVGYNYGGIVTNSYSAGSVTGGVSVGGLVGENKGAVSNSYATGSVTGEWPVGGLVGFNYDGAVSSSYATGSVTGDNQVGGLVGWNYQGAVSDSYSTGIVTRSSGSNTQFGGFVGYNDRGRIINCYSTGSIHYEGAEDPTDKGFAGRVRTDGDYEMGGNFWDTETSGQSSTAGQAMGMTTEEMMDIATFTDIKKEWLDEPWDITAVAPGMTNPAYTWNMVQGQTYPFLSWEGPRQGYGLTISSTSGGSVTVPGEGSFVYVAGTVVGLVAEPDEHYRFVEWTGEIGTIASPTSAETTITMWDDYSITASFEPVDYTLTIGSTEGGSVTDPGEGEFTYDPGTVVDLVAAADEGYQFVEWTGDIDGIDDPTSPVTTITIWGDYSITATFEETPTAKYSLVIDSTEGGSVTGPGEGEFTYLEGTVVNLVAKPETGCRFVEWTGDVKTIADVEAAETTITMTDNFRITANFERTPTVEYALAISSTEGGSVTDPGEGEFTYDAGTVVDLVVVADEGYQFVEWTGDIDEIDDPKSPDTTITMKGNFRINANFEKAPTVEYELDIDSTEGGEVTEPGEGTFTYDAGTVVDLVADADEGYQFVEWTGDVEEIDDPKSPDTIITMRDDYSITAAFEEIPPVEYTLTIDSTEGGEVTEPGEGMFTYVEGTVVHLVAEPETGCCFVDWTGDVDTIADVNSPETTITIEGDYSITANFAAIIELGDMIDETGEIQEEITFESPDGALAGTIPEGTYARDEEGEPLLILTVGVDPNPPAPPEDAHVIGLAYHLGPDGATFEPPLIITITYDPAEIPSDVNEEDLVLAYYDNESGKWVEVPSVVDVEAKTITAEVAHFTTFAIITTPQELAQYKLYVRQDIDVGTLYVWNDGNNLYVRCKLNDEAIGAGWYIAETHLHVGESLNDFPRAGRWGNPMPGQFAYKSKHTRVTEYEYSISLADWEIGDELLIAAQAKVERWDEDELLDEETAWAAIEPGIHRFTEHGSWGTYVKYTVR